MSTRSTFFLAVIALGMLVYFVTTEEDLPGTGQSQRDSEQLVGLDSESINRLELVNVSGSFVFVKDGAGVWGIEAPLAFPADQNAVSSLVSELEFSRRTATLDKGQLQDWDESLTRFGLKPARIQLNIRSKDKNYQLIIGNETARSGLVYALIGDERKSDIAIVPKNIETLLSAPLDNWRSRQVFSFLTDDVTGLSLRKNGSEVEVAREEKGVWNISKPLITPADETEVLSFISNLAALQTSGFISDNAADIAAYGLSSPALSLEIRSGDKTETIRVGAEVQDDKSSYYAQLASRPTVFKVSSATHELISGMMERLRDRRLLLLPDPTKLESFRIEKAGLVLDAKVRGNNRDWVLNQPKSRVLDKAKVETFLKNLKDLRAASFQPASEELRKKSGLNKPALKITLNIGNSGGEAEAKTLIFSAAKKGEIFVETPFRSNIVTIPEAALPQLPAASFEWLEKKLDLKNFGEPSFLKWEQGSKLTLLEKDKEGKWPLQVSGKEIDRSIFDNQLKLIGAMGVAEWSSANDKTFGPVLLRLTVGHEKERTVVEFGKELENGLRLCRLPEEGLELTVSNQEYLLLSIVPSKEAASEAAK